MGVQSEGVIEKSSSIPVNVLLSLFIITFILLLLLFYLFYERAVMDTTAATRETEEEDGSFSFTSHSGRQPRCGLMADGF